LIAVPFVATAFVGVSGQETNGPKVGALGRVVGWLHNLRQRLGRFWSFEISEEYREKAVTIAEKDPDVKALLAEGYKVIRVIPLARSIVDADGDVITRASKAIVVLKKEGSGSYANVWVDLCAGTVTKIVTLTRTVVKGA